MAAQLEQQQTIIDRILRVKKSIVHLEGRLVILIVVKITHRTYLLTLICVAFVSIGPRNKYM